MFKTPLAVAVAVLILSGCEKAVSNADAPERASRVAEVEPTNANVAKQSIPKPTPEQLADYKKRLSENAYHILFEAGTEPPFRNEYHDNHADGMYVSAVTGKPLFSSADKFDSGTGWPSFTKPISADAVIVRQDNDGTGRDEVLDAGSGGHLGHVFNDGPADKGGKRYCMNSAAMKFMPAR